MFNNQNLQKGIYNAFKRDGWLNESRITISISEAIILIRERKNKNKTRHI